MKGMLCDGASVRGIGEGRKTQTRRLAKCFVNECGEPASVVCQCDADGSWIPWWSSLPPADWHDFTQVGGGFKSPFAVGDIVYVKETWALVWKHGCCIHDEAISPRDCSRCTGCTVEYRADSGAKYPGHWPDDCGDDPECGRWRPSIHMPEWASRYHLTVTAVRAQRVQDIPEEDAKAEGVERASIAGVDGGYENYLWHGRCGDSAAMEALSDAWPYQFSTYPTARDSFSSRWEGIYGEGAWERNDWVWAYTFAVEPRGGAS